MKRLSAIYAQDGMPATVASQQAAKQIISEQATHTSIPKYFTQAIRDIWDLQHKFDHRKIRQIRYVLSHPRFRAGFDFLLIRESVEDVEKICSKWWDKIQYANEKVQNKMIADLKNIAKKKKKK